MEVLARRVQHQLRMTLSDWYAWLGCRALRELDWLETPWWAKRLPYQLDISWALNDLVDYLDNPSMLKMLQLKVDAACVKANDLDGLPDMSKLLEAVNELYEASQRA